jgi:putative ABC transport system substrate-binding protein
MRRREFVAATLSIAFVPGSASAQEGAKAVVAILWGAAAESVVPYRRAFLDGLRDQGFSESAGVTVLERHADGSADRLATLAEEIVSLRPAVIVTASTSAVLAVRRVNSAIPIISASLTDPVARGLVTSDARPGGQVTGLHWNLESVPGKQIELLREVVPSSHRIGLLTANSPALEREAKTAAAVIGVELIAVEIRASAEFELALLKLREEQVSAVLVVGSPLFANRPELVSLTRVARLPALFAWREMVEAGGLMSYGVNLADSMRRAASYVSRVLRGEKPGDLPLELPKFELLINLKTAAALRLTIPPTLLARADEVIE